MTMRKLAIFAAVCLAVVIGGYETERNQALLDQNEHLKQEGAALKDRLGGLQRERDELTTASASLDAENRELKSAQRMTELLRLRGEVTRLRSEIQNARTAPIQHAMVSLTVSGDGSFSVGGEPCSPSELVSRLREVVASGATNAIVQNVGVDSNQFMTMVAACDAAGFRRITVASAKEQR